MRKYFAILFGAAIAIAFVWVAAHPSTLTHDNDALNYTQTTGAELIGGEFSLTDHTGKQVTDKDYRGKYLLVFFGFTNCPKVCPLGLHTIAQTLKKLGPTADEVIPIFITIDPERDTVTRLAAFVPAYDRRLVGLTGSSEAVAKVAADYRAYFKKLAANGSDNYNMDHSGVIYFMDPNGRYITHFASELGAEQIARRMEKIIQH